MISQSATLMLALMLEVTRVNGVDKQTEVVIKMFFLWKEKIWNPATGNQG